MFYKSQIQLPYRWEIRSHFRFLVPGLLYSTADVVRIVIRIHQKLEIRPKRFVIRIVRWKLLDHFDDFLRLVADVAERPTAADHFVQNDGERIDVRLL